MFIFSLAPATPRTLGRVARPALSLAPPLPRQSPRPQAGSEGLVALSTRQSSESWQQAGRAGEGDDRPRPLRSDGESASVALNYLVAVSHCSPAYLHNTHMLFLFHLSLSLSLSAPHSSPKTQPLPFFLCLKSFAMSSYFPALLLTVALLSTTVQNATSLSAPSLTLHGSQGSRSPLVNWYLHELKAPFTQAAPRPSPHPFGQIPCLTDSPGDVEIFESGAILLYLADKLDDRCSTAADRAKYTKWVVWANSSLDPICFMEDGNGRVLGTKLDQPGRAVSVLEDILADRDYLVGDELSVADVAVASYLLYVPLFFPSTKLVGIPNIVKYMQRCCERPEFEEAFGGQHAELVRRKCGEFLEDGGGGGGKPKEKKMFGIF